MAAGGIARPFRGLSGPWGLGGCSTVVPRWNFPEGLPLEGKKTPIPHQAGEALSLTTLWVPAWGLLEELRWLTEVQLDITHCGPVPWDAGWAESFRDTIVVWRLLTGAS